MFPDKSPRAFAASAVILPMLIFSGCGGGGEPPPSSQQPATESGIAGTPPEAAIHEEAHLPPPADERSAAAPAEADASSQLGPLPPVDAIHAETLATDVVETIQLAPTYTPMVAGTINATPYWPVWYGTGKPVDGVNCLISGAYHKHALISIYSNGKRLGFPDGIGRVHAGCYHAYEMHVHDVTGIIHIEADVPKQFKLGQWFSLWKQPLSRDAVAGLAGPVRFYIIENGTIRRYDGDPYLIDLLPHREVLIVTGTTMTVVPKYQWPLGV